MSGPLPPASVAVLGAGFIGAPLVRRLANEGRPVRALTRTGRWRDGELPSGVDVRALDLIEATEAEVASAIAGARALVLAYATGGTQDRHALYVEGARKLVAALVNARLERVVYSSSTSALPEVDGPVDESTQAWPESERGRVQREAEQIIREGFGARAVVLRLAGLYGPNRGLGKLYLRRPDATQRGDGWKATNLVHRDDAVQALRLALTMDAAQLTDDGLVVHVCDDDHRPRREMLERLAAKAGLAPPKWEAEIPAGPPAGKQVVNERMKTLLGLELQHPTHDPG